MALPSLCSLGIPLQSRREENSPSYATLSGETDSKFAQLKIFHFRVWGGAEKEGAVGRWVTFPNALDFYLSSAGNTRSNRRVATLATWNPSHGAFSPGL